MTNNKLITIFFLGLMLAPGLETSAQKIQWASYGPAVVELQGNLIVVWKYGPPNFGENPKTDAKVKVPVLVLTKPINVHGAEEDFPHNVEVRGIRRIQLLVFNFKGPYKQLIGKRVTVTGSLIHAHTGGHYTDVVMDVQSIDQLRESR